MKILCSGFNTKKKVLKSIECASFASGWCCVNKPNGFCCNK